MLARALLIVGVAALCVAFQVWRVTPFDPDTGCCDHLYYRSMAYNLTAVARPDLNEPPTTSPLSTAPFYSPANQLNRQPPFVYRVGVPLIARALADGLPGGNIDGAFYALTAFGLFVALAATGLTVLALSHRAWRALAAVVAFAAIDAARWVFWDYMVVDPLAWAALALAALMLALRKRAAFFLVCAVGLAIKETTLFVLPSYVILEWLDGRRVRASTLIATATLGILYVGLRAAVPIPDPGTYSAGVAFGTRVEAKYLLYYTLRPFGALFAAAAFGLLGNRVALALVPLLLMAGASTLFATDTERVFSIAAVPIMVATFGVAGQSRREDVVLAGLLGLMVAIQAAQQTWVFDTRITALSGVLTLLAVPLLWWAQRTTHETVTPRLLPR